MRALKSTSASTTAAAVEIPGEGKAAVAPRSAWRSPVPYLFGGLAAMLGLVAFALLILACSYWNLDGRGGDEEEGEEGVKGTKKTGSKQVCGEQFLVILAGDDRPTCLATPAAAAGGCACINGSDEKVGGCGGGQAAAAGMADSAAASAGENEQQQQQELHLQASSSS